MRDDKKIAQLRKALTKAEARSQRLADARFGMPPGTSRARVTTANARWHAAAEERERIRREIAQLESGAES